MDLQNLKQKIGNSKALIKGYQAVFINRVKLDNTIGNRATIKGYDCEFLAMVSQNLGHNRIDVVYANYLSRYQ